jgi:A/G-specific adenine glycosylase
MEQHGGRFPASEAELRALPGVGDYTAAAISAIAFDGAATPVDGNAERVVARLFAVEQTLPAAKPAIRRLAATLTPPERTGDFAQAMMDLGAGICTPKKPLCAFCPWSGACLAVARGDPQSFPRRGEKTTGLLRRGAAFVVVRADGAVLARGRPENGLLGGMTEVPTTQWSHDFDEQDALAHAPRIARANWRRTPGAVAHVFTHFPLELVVYATSAGANTRAPAGMRWVAATELAGEAFPSVMRKVLVHARVV